MRGTRSWGALLIVGSLALAVVSLGRGSMAGAEGTPSDSAAAAWVKIAAENKEDADKVRERIKGRENMPADSVFRNIKLFKGVPAARVVSIMEMGFSRSLGVKCTLCHVDEKWASEEKKEKQVARDMAAMTRTINDSLLAKIAHLDSDHPTINCTTCHRGQKKPALDMPGGPPRPPVPPTPPPAPPPGR
jgi:hypothetical protein